MDTRHNQAPQQAIRQMRLVNNLVVRDYLLRDALNHRNLVHKAIFNVDRFGIHSKLGKSWRKLIGLEVMKVISSLADLYDAGKLSAEQSELYFRFITVCLRRHNNRCGHWGVRINWEFWRKIRNLLKEKMLEQTNSP